MAATVVWHGDHDERFALAAAIERNCTCELDPESGMRLDSCPIHEAIVHDQRFMDGLIFMRRLAVRLLAEEFSGWTPKPDEEVTAPTW